MSIKEFVHKTTAIVGALVIGMMMSRCNNFEEMNQNPSTSLNMDPNLMLSTIQMQLTGGQYEHWRNGFAYSDEWMQHWSGEYSCTEFGGKGQKRDDFMSSLWDTQYPREIKNIVDMVNRTSNNPLLTNIHSISRIMKVYIFSRLTDLHGDIPYFQAGGGYAQIFAPKYDKQEDIYNDFFKELDESVNALDATKDKITHDIYFNGAINKWKKFGNSLRLRLAMRLTKVNPSKAKTEAEASIAAGVMTSTDDMVVMKHINVPFNGDVYGGNGLSYTFMNSTPLESAFRLSTTFANYLVETEDPRITLLGRSYLANNEQTDITNNVYEKLGDYRKMALPPSTFRWEATGAPVTINVNDRPTTVQPIYQFLQPSKYITKIDAPYIVMSYAEVRLWMAEAAYRTWTTGVTAQEHFSKALEAGVKQMETYGAPNVDQTIVNNFVSTNKLKAGRELEQINNQLWVNFALNGLESYANWRRSGYPEIVYPNRTPSVNQSNGEIPRRMQYPVNEYLLNQASVMEAVNRISTGKDEWTARVWWDVE
jgi:hypothetical protein